MTDMSNSIIEELNNSLKELEIKVIRTINQKEVLQQALRKAIQVMKDNNLDEQLSGEFCEFEDAIEFSERS